MRADENKVVDDGSRGSLLAGRRLDFVVAGLGLLAFIVLMLLLTRWLFPAGIKLTGEAQVRNSETGLTDTPRQLGYAGQTEASNEIARLVALQRTVQVKAHGALAWSAAQKGLVLLDRDSLQTSGRSGATLMLDDSSLLQVGPNSLIVFQNSATDLLTPTRTNSLVMMEGTLSGQFASSRDSTMHLEVSLPNGIARFRPGDDDAAIAFDLNINPDQSSSVSVHSGEGLISVAGRSVSVSKQHGLTIGVDGELLEQRKLPGQPSRVRPLASTVYQYRDLPPPLIFSWAAVPDVSHYRFRLARDSEMDDVVIDERISSSDFEYQGLQDGTYYWQVSALDGFLQGPAAGPNQLRLIRDEQPPALQLLPPELINGQLVVRGRTDPGARVYIQGIATTAPGGSFETSIPINDGANLLVVEAVDRAGNVAYDSQIINSKTSISGGGQ